MPRPLALVAAVLLLLTGIVRIGWMVAHQPVLGYANQFDMGRTSACLGLWPDLPGPARYEAHREAPIARYAEGEQRPDECYVSSELAFAGLALASWKVASMAGWADRGAMDLRFVGAVKATVLVLLALAFSWLLREWPARMLTHAAVFALVLADPVVTLWLNTLYTEYAAVLFLYAALVTLAVIVAETPETAGWYVAFGSALLGLGLSRQQHLLLPVFLFVLALPVVWRHFRPAALPLAALAAIVLGLQAIVISRPASIVAANNVNVVLGTLLPAASKQDKALEHLDLPVRCATMIGATWYVQMGEDVAVRCPEALSIRRAPIVKLILLDPATVAGAFLRAAPLAQPALLRYVGIEAGGSYRTLEDQRSPFALSTGTLIEKLPAAAYLGALLAALLALPLSLFAWMRTTVRNGDPSLDSVLGAALSGVVLYAFASSVLGDGVVEIPRHVHLGNIALQAMVVLGVALLLTRLAGLGPRRAGSRPASIALAATPWYEWSLLTIVVALAASNPLWLAAWKSQPVSAGVVDEPERNVYVSPIIRLHGWAMNPFGPARAFTVIDNAAFIDAKPWTHPADPQGVALARVFPTYRDPRAARFEVTIDVSPYAGKPILLKTYARSREGVATEIDRRVLVRAK